MKKCDKEKDSMGYVVLGMGKEGEKGREGKRRVRWLQRLVAQGERTRTGEEGITFQF